MAQKPHIFMGGFASQAKKYKAPPRLVKEILSRTKLNRPQVTVLYRVFRQMAQNCKDRLYLAEFQDSLGIRSTTLARRIFIAFGMDSAQSVTFPQFCEGVYLLSDTADFKERVRFCLAIYDFDSDGTIDKSELRELLRSCLEENENITISDAAIENVILRTFQEYDSNHDGKITYDDLLEGAQVNPTILNLVRFNRIFPLVPSLDSFAL